MRGRVLCGQGGVFVTSVSPGFFFNLCGFFFFRFVLSFGSLGSFGLCFCGSLLVFWSFLGLLWSCVLWVINNSLGLFSVRVCRCAFVCF